VELEVLVALEVLEALEELEALEVLEALEELEALEVGQVWLGNRWQTSISWRNRCCRDRLCRQMGSFHKHLWRPMHSSSRRPLLERVRQMPKRG